MKPSVDGKQIANQFTVLECGTEGASEQQESARLICSSSQDTCEDNPASTRRRKLAKAFGG